MTDQITASPYDRVGGAPAIREVVDRLYRLILDDEALAPYFASTDLPNLKQHMASLLTTVLGGPNQYLGRDLAAAHANLKITKEHFWVVSVYLLSVLNDLSVPLDIQRAVGTVLASTEDQVVTA